jgi:hypothetical protein
MRGRGGARHSIAIAAVNRGMIRTAAAVADGLVNTRSTRKYIAETVRRCWRHAANCAVRDRQHL